MKYIGIDIGATNLKAGLVDDAGQILAKQKMKIAQIETPDLLARHLARMTEELAAEVGVDLDEIFSIGVGVRELLYTVGETDFCKRGLQSSFINLGSGGDVFVEREGKQAPLPGKRRKLRCGWRVLCRSRPPQQALCDHHPRHGYRRGHHP